MLPERQPGGFRFNILVESCPSGKADEEEHNRLKEAKAEGKDG